MDELRLYRTVLETSGELIWSIDAAGRWSSLNAAGVRRIYGREAAELLGRPFVDLVVPELRERDYAVFSRVLEGQALSGHETRHLKSDGTPVDLSFNAVALRDAQGRLLGAAGTARDISEGKRAAAALYESVQKLRLAVEAADLEQWEWSAAAGAAAAAEAARVLPDDRSRYRTAMVEALERGAPFEVEFRVAADTGVRWIAARGVPMFDAAGRPERVVGVSQDITARKEREEAVRFLAYHDSLTGLPNRRLLDDRLVQALHLAQRRDRRLAVMLIDLDDFKRINDTLGHRAGDSVLREVARRLAACVRKADTLARHGGDEFVMVLSDVQGEADCRLVAEKALGALAQPLSVDGTQVSVGASIGISLFPADAGDGAALLRNADAAMYRAKQRGRGGYAFFVH